MWLDGRIAVRLVSTAGVGKPSERVALVRIGGSETAAWLRPGWAAVRDLPAASLVGHAAGCRCCSGRSGLADALALLFVQRARGELPFFDGVLLLVDPEHLHDVVTILTDDSAVAGRFRLESRK